MQQYWVKVEVKAVIYSAGNTGSELRFKPWRSANNTGGNVVQTILGKSWGEGGDAEQTILGQRGMTRVWGVRGRHLEDLRDYVAVGGDQRGGNWEEIRGEGTDERSKPREGKMRGRWGRTGIRGARDKKMAGTANEVHGETTLGKTLAGKSSALMFPVLWEPSALNSYCN